MNASELDKERLCSLWAKLQKDDNLAQKLDLLEELTCDEQKSVKKDSKRKAKSSSKLVNKKLCVGKQSESPASSLIPQAVSPEKTGQDDGTSNAGGSQSSAEDNEESENEMDHLEREMLKDDEDGNQEENDESDNDEEFNYIGGTPPAKWTPSARSLKLYLKVANIELKKDELDKIQDEFKTEPDLDPHFNPPRFPQSLWSAVQGSSSDLFKLKFLFRTQENLYLAIKPLLASLDSCPKEIQDNIIKSIQLICSANLNLNRFRRFTIAYHLKPELKKQILSIPVQHDSFFGDDFAKVSDSIIKEQTALDKIIKKHIPKVHVKSNQNFSGSHSSNSRGKQFFRGRGGRGHFKRGRGSLRGTSHRNDNQNFSSNSSASQSTTNTPGGSSHQGTYSST